MEEWPEILRGDYEITFRYDVQSIVNYYAKLFKNHKIPCFYNQIPSQN